MELKDKMMKNLLGVEDGKIKSMVETKVAYLKGQISMEEAKKRARAHGRVTGQEFALSEQYMTDFGISDFELTDRIDELLEIYEGVRVAETEELEAGHPIHTYLLESQAIEELLKDIEKELSRKFIKNQWLELYEKLSEIKKHLARKQNQLYPMLEKKGFDKPTKVMWSLEDIIEEKLRQARASLEEDREDFLSLQPKLVGLIRDLLEKEVEILYPTALDLISDEEFGVMRKGDDEIGYCLIDNPQDYGEKDLISSHNNELLKDLAKLVAKHGLTSNETLEVSRGLLSLEQINLIFQHMKIDLSYVDEDDIVRFYTDTKHRIFPRSPGVIGRKVENCHPKESLGMVTQIVELFRAGVQDEAEFWIDSGDKFIYINFTAVRDEGGKFRGVLEMMQDVTHIRSLQGSSRLATWSKKD